MIQISWAAARVNAGLSQIEVAERVGVSRFTILKWEKGQTSPTIKQAKELAELYNIPLDNIRLSDT